MAITASLMERIAAKASAKVGAKKKGSDEDSDTRIAAKEFLEAMKSGKVEEVERALKAFVEVSKED